MKTIGVIGGMGPKSTIDFLSKIISLTPAKKDQEHLNMIVYMNPQIPDRTSAIINNKESPTKALTESAKLLQDARVDFIVIPCVTAHFWFEEIKNSINIPILSLLDITSKEIRKQGKDLKKIGILATSGAIQSRLFENAFESGGYEIVYPEERVQTDYVMKGIYNIKMGKEAAEVKSLFLHACTQMIEKGAQIIIAACTEIPLSITDKDIQIPLIDVNMALAEETVRFASNLKNNST